MTRNSATTKTTKTTSIEPGSLKRRIIASVITARYDGWNVLDFLADRFTYRDRTAWRERLDKGEFLLNGQTAAAGNVLHGGMTLQYLPTDIREPEVDLHYEILYETPEYLVIDKSGDLPVHPAGVFYAHTLWYLLTERYGTIHPVNRLDRETSGILIAARNPAMAAELARTPMTKRYTAIVFGKFTHAVDAEGTLIHDEASRIRRKRKFILHGTEGETCRTVLTPGGQAGPYSIVHAELYTGRMHQIRATLYSLGFPLAGDKLYGPDEALFVKRAKEGSLSPEDHAKLGMKRQALHAGELVFKDPRTGETRKFESPLPEDMRALLK